jgi:hypothetical protein
VLSRGESRHEEKCEDDQALQWHHFDHWGKRRCYAAASGFVRVHTTPEHGDSRDPYRVASRRPSVAAPLGTTCGAAPFDDCHADVGY